MQGNIAQALALTTVGNAFLQGRDVSDFWPNARVFMFSKSCDFRVVDEKNDTLIAADPLAWFATLRGSCKGLRLHNAPRPRGPGQSIPVEERMMVGFVGGGPAWLIEAVGKDRSRIWQGYDRLGDRDDPQRKIWLNTYLLEGETTPQEFSATPLAQAVDELESVLPKIETLARNAKLENFAECFRSAREALSAKSIDADPLTDDYVRYAGLDLPRLRVLGAASAAWVFGGMGSWNDVGAGGAEADALSERLLRALIDAICAVANSTYAA